MNRLKRKQSDIDNDDKINEEETLNNERLKYYY
jgi:hypothetical protein